MRYISAAALVAAQLAFTPVQGATLEPTGAVQARTGAFAGARLRVAIGGRETGKLRAGLGIGPSQLSLAEDGRVRSRFGDGFELGVVGDAPVRLSFAGRSMDRIKLAADGKDGGGVPTWAWIVGGTVLVLGAAFLAVDAVADAATE